MADTEADACAEGDTPGPEETVALTLATTEGVAPAS
jgi:hypothetical protein